MDDVDFWVIICAIIGIVYISWDVIVDRAEGADDDE